MSLLQAAHAAATAREEVRAANARRYRFSGWLAATDRCLDILEGLNLAEVVEVPGRRLVALRRLLATLPPSCRPELPDGVLTQTALDRVFDAQEVLFRMLPGADAGPDPVDSEEMDRWEALCRWLDETGGVARADVDEATTACLQVMRSLKPRGLVFVAQETWWRAWPTWQKRLADMRAGEGS